eukprot:gene34053-biopygen7325
MGWDAALHECWRAEPVQKSHTELAVRMQGAALGSKTVGNYRPKAKAFIDFCDSEGPQRLPAEEATVRLYIAHLLAKVIVQAASMQPYLSAINNYHEDMGFPGLAKAQGQSRGWRPCMQVEAAAAAGEERTGLVQLLPHWEQVRDAGLWAQGSPVVMAGQGSYWRMLWELGKLQSAQANDWVREALGKLGSVPQEGGHFSGHSTPMPSTADKVNPLLISDLLADACFVVSMLRPAL